jgi:hypothetical protein
MKNLKLAIASFLFSFVILGCKKEFDLEPEGVKLEKDVLTSSKDIQPFLNGTYDVFANTFNGKAQIFSELLSDNIELNQNNDDLKEVYNRGTIFFNGTLNGFYTDLYRIVNRANILLEKTASFGADLTPEERNRIIGEAKFLRAYAHWETCRLYAQPYGFTADNSHLGVVLRFVSDAEPKQRSTVAQVYTAVIQDLTEAESFLPTSNGSQAVYADVYAAKALLAKVYFQMNKYSEAFNKANEVVSSNLFAMEDSLNRFSPIGKEFRFSAKETIFGIRSASINDMRGGYFRGQFKSDGNDPPMRIHKQNNGVTKGLIELITDEEDDLRIRNFRVKNSGASNEYYAASKFDGDVFSLPLIHMTELHLILAESAARKEAPDLSAAIQNINLIIKRAYKNPNANMLLPGDGAEVVLNRIERERRIELACEGDRTHTLKRYATLGQTALRIRNAPWNCPGMALQFPISEKTTNFTFNVSGGCN